VVEAFADIDSQIRECGRADSQGGHPFYSNKIDTSVDINMHRRKGSGKAFEEVFREGRQTTLDGPEQDDYASIRFRSSGSVQSTAFDVASLYTWANIFPENPRMDPLGRLTNCNGGVSSHQDAR
jgi:hypothetical protein